MKKVKYIKTLDGMQGVAKLYSTDNKENPFIVVSRANTFDRGDETMIFPGTENGIKSYGDLYAGYGEDHNTALTNYGIETIK